MAELTAAQKMMLEAKRRAAEKRGEDFDMDAESAKLLKPKSAPAAKAEPAPAKAEAPAQPVAEAAPAKAVAQSAGESTSVESSPAKAAPAAPAAKAAPAPKPKPAPAPAPEPEPAGQDGINRREFLTYAWGAALGLIAAQGGYATYMFMYPRFRAGEFGGKFPLGSASILPSVGTPPEANPTGKFWLVQTDEGVKALYMVCTHLGCLYKWEASNSRFECPCHGSKFTAEGEYIEGPAPRSLDHFVVEIVQNGEIVSTTTDSGDAIIAAAIPSPDAEVVVDTGSKILGKLHHGG